MPSKYSGVSSFFDSPAGKALYRMGQGGGDVEGGDVGLGPAGGLFASMRPGLRNALADEAGSSRLRALERRKPERIDYHDGPADGGLGARPEFYIPDTMDPIANMETARQQTRANFAVDDELEGIADTGARRRQAEGTDYTQELAARRYWDPMTMSARENDFQNKYALATEPARIAGSARTTEAEIDAAVKRAVAAMQQPAKNTQALGSASAGGVFGRDQYGDPMAPPPSAGTQALGEMLQPQRIDPAVEAEIKQWESKGFPREEIIQHFKSIGKIK